MSKNIAAFIIVCVLIVVGWQWLQTQLWPPRRPDQKQAKNDGAMKDDAKKDNEGKDGDKKGPEQKGPEISDPGKKPKPPDKETAPQAKPEAKAAPEPPPETYALGSDATYVRAIVTTRGAGVQKLTLTRFKAADYLGQPVDSDLELIQEDSFRPSFLMYHYDDVAKHPVYGLGEKTWRFEGQSKNESDVEEVKFSVRVPGQEDIKIVKTYRLGPKDYHLTLLLEIERDKAAGVKDHKFRYQLTGAHGLPVEGEWYTTTFRRALIAWVDDRNNLYRALDNEDAARISHRAGGDQVPAVSSDKDLIQYAGVVTQFFAAMLVVDDVQPDKNLNRRQILESARPTLESTEKRGKIHGKVDGAMIEIEEAAAVVSKLGEVVKPAKIGRYHLLPHVQRHIEEAKLRGGDQVIISSYETPDNQRVATWIRRGQTPRPYLDDITVRVKSKPIDLSPGAKVSHQFMLYHGPVKARLLHEFSGDKAVPPELIDRYTDTLHLATLTDYQSPGPFGSFAKAIRFTDLLIACTKVMHLLLYWLSFLVLGNNGLSILLLTVLVRGLMFPISKKQALFSIKMQEVAPEMKKLAEKYKDDPKGKMQATSELYKKHNVHPLGGCLPMLLQLPIFLGLYYALQESISFRLASFLWIDNLAAPDMLRWWSESIPYISEPDSQGGMFYLGPFFNLLPICAVALMFFQQKMMTPPPTDEQQAMNLKAMQFAMIFMGIFFYKMASGLCIYFIASSLWGMAERRLLPKKPKLVDAAVAPPPSFSGKTGPQRGKGKQPPKPEGNATVKKVKDWWAELLKEAQKK